MKIRTLSISLFAFLFMNFNVFSQFNGYEYYRKVEDIGKTGWYNIKISHKDFSVLNNDFSSLRLYEIDEGKIVETPYILNRNDYYSLHDINAKWEEIPVKEMRLKENNKQKTTNLYVKLGISDQIRAFQIFIKQDRDHYQRTIRLYDNCGPEHEDSWWSSDLTESTISSVVPNKIFYLIDYVYEDCITLQIENGDDQPLVIDSVKFFTTSYELKAKFFKNKKYLLIYGNKHKRSPEYDIINFEYEIPDKLPTLKVYEEKAFSNIDENKEEGKLITLQIKNEKKWIWGIMIGVIVVIGIFTYYLVRTTVKED